MVRQILPQMSVLRTLKEVILELGSDEIDIGSQAKIWGKIRAKQQCKHFVQSRILLKQNEEKGIQEVLDRGAQEGSGGPGYGVGRGAFRIFCRSPSQCLGLTLQMKGWSSLFLPLHSSQD